MVNAAEMVKLQEKQDKSNLRLAEVIELNENGTAMVRFYGEDIASQKTFAYLASYSPDISDVVLMMVFGDTYIIIGKVMIESDTPIEYVTGQELEDALQDFITSQSLSEMLSRYAGTNHNHDNAYAATNHNHDNSYALKIHSHENYAATNHNHKEIRSTDGYIFGFNLTANGNPCLVPSTNSVNLGYTGNYRLKEIYSSAGTINTSDKRQKKNIHPMSDKHRVFFKKLIPSIYQFRKNDSNRYHYGFVAQDVEKALNDAGMTSKDFAGFIKTPVKKKGKDDFEHGLRYSEFIALNTYMIQGLLNTVDEHKVIIQELLKIVGELKEKIELLEKRGEQIG